MPAMVKTTIKENKENNNPKFASDSSNDKEFQICAAFASEQHHFFVVIVVPNWIFHGGLVFAYKFNQLSCLFLTLFSFLFFALCANWFSPFFVPILFYAICIGFMNFFQFFFWLESCASVGISYYISRFSVNNFFVTHHPIFIWNYRFPHVENAN